MDEIGARAKKKGNGIEMETTNSILGIKRSLQANEENEEEGMQKWHMEVSLSLLI